MAKLLREMLKVEKDFWLRLLYLYPDEIDEELIAVMKSDPRICPYLDMPIQHIDDGMLKAMHRTTSRAQSSRSSKRSAGRFRNVAIRTSLMVGFPGETDEQFEALLAFVREVPLDHVGIFQFSLEKEAYAAKLSGQIAPEIKQERFERLVEAQRKSVRKQTKKMIGRKVRAIVEGYHPESNLLLRARHSGQCPEIDGQIIINDPTRCGRIRQNSTMWRLPMQLTTTSSVES